MTEAFRAWRAGAPYNALPVLPPACELETRAVLKSCIEARAALAELTWTFGARPARNSSMTGRAR